MADAEADVTTLLQQAATGDRQAQDALYRRVEAALRQRARAFLRHEPPSYALQTTVLVNDTFLELTAHEHRTWENRARFYGCAAKVMRHIFIDYVRQRQSQQEGGHQPRLSLDQLPEPAVVPTPDPVTQLELHEALEKLAATHPELAEIIDLHYYGGWPLKEIAEDILHAPYTTILHRRDRALAQLYRILKGG